MFCCSFAFTIAAFAVAIFVNNSLNFFNASAILPLHETNPLNAQVSSDTAFMRIVLGVTYGFVMYWCLKNTVLLSLVTLFYNKDVETLLMLYCRLDVEAGVCTDVPGLSILGFDVGHNPASQGCKQAFHVVVLPMDMVICRHVWCNAAL